MGSALICCAVKLDAGKLHLGVNRRVPLTGLRQVHAEVATAPINGKIVFVVPGA